MDNVMKTNRSATGYRDETGDGKVMHYRIGLGVACRTGGTNRQASPSRRDVNCVKCLAILARVQGR